MTGVTWLPGPPEERLLGDEREGTSRTALACPRLCLLSLSETFPLPKDPLGPVLCSYHLQQRADLRSLLILLP